MDVKVKVIVIFAWTMRDYAGLFGWIILFCVYLHD